MDRFIIEVAKHYYQQDGADISSRTFVFPSRRAILFFQRALGEIAERPILAPRCITISDFLWQLVPEMQLIDHTALLFELYACYKAEREEQAQARGLSKEEACESFDEFLFWGNIILSDFDLIDRHLVDASVLYRNLGNIKELRDELTDLDTETLNLLEKFWENFINPHKQTEAQRLELRQRFMDFWMSLGGVYRRLTHWLIDHGLAYEGMIYRYIAEHRVDLVSSLIDKEEGRYVFVGLFEITPGEMKLLQEMHRRGIAEMYWDEAVAIVQDPEHPAHHMMANNIDSLGRTNSRVDLRAESLLPSVVKVYRSSSTISQVKALPVVMKSLGTDLLQEHSPKSIDTAIVLPSEQLLLPVVSAIPESFRHLNITLGYPLARTPIAIFVHRWLRLLASYRRGAYPLERVLSVISLQVLQDCLPLLRDFTSSLRGYRRYMVPQSKLIKLIDELLDNSGDKAPAEELQTTSRVITLLFAPYCSGQEVLHALSSLLECLSERMLRDAQAIEAGESRGEEATDQPHEPMSFDLEFVYHYRLLTTRLGGLMEQYHEWDISVESMVRLLDGLTVGVTIPFEGNPLQGLQVMGLLESRLLHFDTIIYLSAQEGSLPTKRNLSTLIPATLRAGYHLPSIEWLDTADAYRFYQSIARCQRLVMLYGSEDPIGGGRGEESRYLRQMRMLYNVEVEEVGIQSLLKPDEPFAYSIDKRRPEVHAALQRFLQPGIDKRGLSATALSDYKACPLRFYYRHVLRINDDGGSIDQLLGSGDFGTILHNTMQELYAHAPLSSDETGREITRSYIEQFLAPGNKAIEREVIGQYQSLFASSRQERQAQTWRRSDLDTLTIYYIDLLVEYVKKILLYDKRATPFYFVGAEQSVETTFPLQDSICVNLKGTIDRLDICRSVYHDDRACLRILDYKTGSDKLRAIRVRDIDKLVADYNHQDKAMIQTLFYCELIHSSGLVGVDSSMPLVPGVLIVREMRGNLETYSPYLYDKGSSTPLCYDADVRARFVSALKTLLKEIFDLDRPFVQTKDTTNCQFCPFTRICGV